MKRRTALTRRIAGCIIMACALLIAAPALAKGDFARLTVTGGALETPLTVTDPALLGFFAFADFSQGDIPQPDGLGPEYTITRFEQDEAGKQIAWDSLRYYPSRDGGQGAVYYDGLIDGQSEYDDRWYPARPEAETALMALIERHTSQEFDGPQPAALSLVLLVGGAGLAIWLRNRRTSTPESGGTQTSHTE